MPTTHTGHLRLILIGHGQGKGCTEPAFRGAQRKQERGLPTLRTHLAKVGHASTTVEAGVYISDQIPTATNTPSTVSTT
jgi:hypothetical protein